MADMRPGFRNRFKGAPQQGTLFSAKAGELDPTGQRYGNIRGFTPERQRAVGEAMGEVGFSSGGLRDTPGDVGPAAIMSKQEFQHVGDESKRDWAEGGARMREALARSTSPVDDIKSVERFAVAPNLGMNGVWMPKDKTILFGRSAAEVEKHRGGFGTGNPTPEVQRLNAGQTVVHELGHAVDPQLAPLRGKRNAVRDSFGDMTAVEGYDEPENLGHLEQAADDYAEKHFRPDPRGGRRQQFAAETGMYPGAAPSDIPPGYLAGYSKWAKRSDAAVGDLSPRWAAAEQRGTQHPKTPDQESYANRMARQKKSRQPDLGI